MNTWAVGVQGELCMVCLAGWRSPLPCVHPSSCPAAATWAHLPRGFLVVLPHRGGHTSATLEGSPEPGGPVSLSTSFWDHQLLFCYPQPSRVGTSAPSFHSWSRSRPQPEREGPVLVSGWEVALWVRSGLTEHCLQPGSSGWSPHPQQGQTKCSRTL